MASGALGITESTFGPGERNSAPQPRNSASDVKITKKPASQAQERSLSLRRLFIPANKRREPGVFPSRGFRWGSLSGQLIER